MLRARDCCESGELIDHNDQEAANILLAWPCCPGYVYG